MGGTAAPLAARVSWRAQVAGKGWIHGGHMCMAESVGGRDVTMATYSAQSSRRVVAARRVHDKARSTGRPVAIRAHALRALVGKEHRGAMAVVCVGDAHVPPPVCLSLTRRRWSRGGSVEVVDEDVSDDSDDDATA